MVDIGNTSSIGHGSKFLHRPWSHPSLQSPVCLLLVPCYLCEKTQCVPVIHKTNPASTFMNGFGTSSWELGQSVNSCLIFKLYWSMFLKDNIVPVTHFTQLPHRFLNELKTWRALHMHEYMSWYPLLACILGLNFLPKSVFKSGICIDSNYHDLY